MRKKLTALFMAAMLSVPMLSVGISAADVAKTDVIIEIDSPVGSISKTYTKLVAGLTKLLIPSMESGYVYDTLLCGFHARLPASVIDTVEKLGYVKNVYISGSYGALSDGEEMSAAEFVGYSTAEEYGLCGKGVKVAVIDSGFDVSHSAFASDVYDGLDLSVFDNRFSILRLNAQMAVKSASELRYNSKIPFRFDYFGNDTDVSADSSHGTHVAGIIGAAETEASSMHGIAPGCQLLLMKIFDDSGSKGYDHLMVAALEDALKMDADIINLSLGHYSGSTDPKRTLNFDSILESARKKGCTVIAAVGNDGVSTVYSSAAYNYGADAPHVSYTDYGTVGAPASVSGVIGVASADNSVSYGKYLIHADNSEFHISFTDTTADSGTKPDFTKQFDGKELEYVAVPGLGKAEDFASVDVKGKLALIKRGEIPFAEKVNNAFDNGAVGVIVYNNVEDDVFYMDLTDAKLPAVAISMEDGLKLISEPVHRILISDVPLAVSRTESGGKISSTSARGATPSLTIKPDITGIGGYVFSTVNGGGYAESSGTSMAAPQISGVFAVIYEKLRSDGLTDKAVIAEEAKLAVMNGAVPLFQDNGVEYSPRAQGVGLASIEGALERELSVTYKDSGLYKAELYDRLGEAFEFTVTVKNLTDKPLEVSLGATLTSDGYTELTVKERTEYFNSLEAVSDSVSVIAADGKCNINRYAKDFAPSVFTLAGGESRDITLTVTLDGEYHKTLSKIFTNGYFAEGYVYAATENSTVSLPYMGYIGDWTAASVTDGSPYLEEYEHFKGTVFYVEVDGKHVPSGVEIFDEKPVYDDSLIAFSPNRDGKADEILLGAWFLRNVKDASMTITDSEGNEVFSKELGIYITKAKAYIENTTFYFFWDGGDGIYSRFTFPDGRYTLTASYVLDYGEDNVQTYSYDLLLDTKPPVIKDVHFENGKLTVSASDESDILKIELHSTADNTPTVYQDPDSTAVFDLSDYTGNEIYYTVTDAAYNSTTGKLTLPSLVK